MRDLCYSQDLSLFIRLSHSPVIHKSSPFNSFKFPELCYSNFDFQNQKSKILYLKIPPHTIPPSKRVWTQEECVSVNQAMYFKGPHLEGLLFSQTYITTLLTVICRQNLSNRPSNFLFAVWQCPFFTTCERVGRNPNYRWASGLAKNLWSYYSTNFLKIISMNVLF